MLVPIDPPEGGEARAWGAIELQGTIEPRAAASLGGLEVGSLLNTGEGRLQLTIGNHNLDGSRVKVKKPLAVLCKETDERGMVSYKVVGVVRERCLFTARPRPIIEKAA